MNFALRLGKPKGAPKCVRVGHYWLWNLATSGASPPKAKSQPLGAFMLIVHVKVVACSTVSGDGSVEVVLGAPFGTSPCEFLCDSESTNGDYVGDTMRQLS